MWLRSGLEGFLDVEFTSSEVFVPFLLLTAPTLSINCCRLTMYSVLYKNDLIHSSQPQPYEVGAITVPILQIGSGDKERSSNFPKVKAISNLDLEVVFITTTPHYFFMNIHIPYNAIIIC